MTLNSLILAIIRNHWWIISPLYTAEFIRDVGLSAECTDWRFGAPFLHSVSFFPQIVDAVKGSQWLGLNHVIVNSISCFLFGMKLVMFTRKVPRGKVHGALSSEVKRWVDYHYITIFTAIAAKMFAEIKPEKFFELTGFHDKEAQFYLSIFLVIEVGFGLGVKLYLKYYNKPTTNKQA